MNDKNEINLKISPIGPYWALSFSLNINDKLRASEYLPFSTELTFAGRSKIKGILLSHASKGTPNIGGIPITTKKPKGWLNVESSWHNLIINTEKPDLQVFLSQEEEELYLNPINLVERTVFRPKKGFQELECLPQTPQLLDFHKRDKQTFICFDDYDMHILIPSKHKLPLADWRILERHITTENPTADYSHTIPIEKADGFPLKGNTMPDVERLWGVTGNPVAYHKGYLIFSTIQVQDKNKASNVHPSLAYFKELRYRYKSQLVMETSLEELVQNPKFKKQSHICLEELTGQPLLEPERENILALKQPAFNERTVFISSQIAPKFITPLATAVHTRQCDTLPKFVWHSENGLPKETIKYVLNTDLAKIPRRNRKQEQSAQQELNERLKAVGAPTPKHVAKLTNKEIEDYINLYRQIQNEEVFPISECPILTEETIDFWSDWLEKHKLLVDCPVTGDRFIKKINSLEELAALPGFEKQLSDIFDDFKLFKQCLLSDKIRTLLLIKDI
jgi:hypothetical protein